MERLYDLLHRVSRATQAAGRAAADLSFLTSLPDAVEGRRDVTLQAGPDRSRPSFLCVYGALALTVDFPRAAYGIQSDEATYYMMGHSLAEDGDLDLSQGGSRPGLAGVPDRAHRRVPQEGPRRRRAAAPPISDPEADLGVLRQVVHLPAVRRAVREAVRHQRLSRAARAPAVARGAVRLPVPARARPAPGRRRSLAGAFVMASDRARLLRLDHAGGVQLLARPARLLLLALQGGRRARRTRRADTQWLFAASQRRRRRGAARHRDVLEAVERAAVRRADRRLAAVAASRGGRSR